MQASRTPTVREQQRVLQEAVHRARAGAPDGIVVFDLDSTLFDNRPRQARILREYGVARDLPPLTTAKPEHFTSWSITSAMVNAGLPQDEAIRRAQDARGFWRERFFTSEYCLDDVAIVGAAQFVAAIVDSGARVAYVTGRHVAMGDGTVGSFRLHGFPIPDGGRVTLHLKPTFEMSDDDWKRRASGELRAIGPVEVCFDNEPAHVNIYVAQFPGAMVIHLATDHSGRPISLAPGVQAIADFNVNAARR